MTRVFIVARRTGRRLEVVSYAAELHYAVLRTDEGEIIKDTCFYPHMLKRGKEANVGYEFVVED